jgi:hypothetical protein
MGRSSGCLSNGIKVRRARRLEAPVHYQFPFIANSIVAQDVNVAVTAPDLHVAIVGSMPLVDIVGDLDGAAVEPKSPHLFRTAFVHVAFDLDLHGAPAIATISSLPLENVGLMAQDPRPLPSGRSPPPGVLGQLGDGSLHHASLVDWFIA